jgi:anti-sigma factor RsiW
MTMDRKANPPLTDDELHALVDGQVPAADRAGLEARLAQDPAAQATVAKWRKQRDALRGLHRQVLDEPVPSTLLAAAQHTAAAQQSINQWWRWGGVAAGVMMAFGVGWLSHGQWQVQQPSAVLVKAAAPLDFVRQASFAHAVYSPEVRHPVEVTAAEQDHLVQWLSKRVGKPLKVPNLSSQGYELVGGRLLPGEAGARAQFMFQNTTGVRVTLYLGAVDGAQGKMDARETAFSFAKDGPVPSFYWVDQGFGYALAGQLPREALMKLVKTAYAQL